MCDFGKNNFEVRDVNIHIDHETGRKFHIDKFFKFENDSLGVIRAFRMNGKPWFVGTDVARVLQYKNVSSVLVDKIKKRNRIAMTIADLQPMLMFRNTRKGYLSKISLINQFGLYEIVSRCTFKNIEHLQDWITEDIIPSFMDSESHIKIPTSKKELYLELSRVYSRAAELEEEREAAEAKLGRRNNVRVEKEGMDGALGTKEAPDECISQNNRIFPIEDNGILIREVAIRLRQIGLLVSEKMLRYILRDVGFFTKDSGSKGWFLAQYAESKGYGSYRIYCDNMHPNTKIRSKTVYMTEEGYRWFADIMKRRKDDFSKFGSIID